MRNKLSLLVNFLGVDKLSGSLKSIITNSQAGSKSLKAMRKEAKDLEKQLKEVKDLQVSQPLKHGLLLAERELRAAIEDNNRLIKQREGLIAIEGRRNAMADMGANMRSKGQSHMIQAGAMSAPFILAAKAAGDFSSGMVDIQQKANLTDRSTAELGKTILTMANDAKQLPEDMRAGLDQLLALGGDTLGLDAAIAAMGPAGKLATAYKVDIPDAAAAAYASINNLKVPAEQTSQIFDAMAEAGNQGGFEVKDMARHFPTLTAQMQALGQKGLPAVADLSAALQVAMNTAGGADEAGNNIVNLLAKINSPGTIRAFKKNFGVNLPAEMKKLTDSGYTALEAITMITKKATGGDEKKLAFAFEDRQAQMGILALIQGLDRYREIRAAAMDSEGTVDGAFDQRVLNDASVSWRAFSGNATALAITLGTTLLPVMSEGMAMLNGMVSHVSAWAQANPELAGSIIKGAAALLAFKFGLGVVMFGLGSILGPLGTVIATWQKYRLLGSLAATFPKIATAFTLLRTAVMFLGHGFAKAGLLMMGNPMVRIISVIVLVVGLLAYTIYKNWDAIKAGFSAGLAYLSGAWETFKSLFMTGVDFVLNYPSRMMQIGRDIISGLANGILAAPGAVWNALKSVVTNGLTNVKAMLGIKSPSRVFMGIGSHVSEGMALGIEGGTSRANSAISNLAKGITTAGAVALSPVAAAATPAAAGQGAGGIAITLNIYQQPGENAEALADRIMRLIDQKTAINSRRSYEDHD